MKRIFLVLSAIFSGWGIPDLFSSNQILHKSGIISIIIAAIFFILYLFTRRCRC